MKKLLFAVALIAASGVSAVYAQTPSDPQTQTTTAVEYSFNETTAEELPQEVKDAVAKQYESMTIKAAYVKDAAGVKTFKVTLADAEGATSDVLFSEKGEILPNE